MVGASSLGCIVFILLEHSCNFTYQVSSLKRKEVIKMNEKQKNKIVKDTEKESSHRFTVSANVSLERTSTPLAPEKVIVRASNDKEARQKAETLISGHHQHHGPVMIAITSVQKLPLVAGLGDREA